MGVTRINSPMKSDWFARLRDLSVSCTVCFDDEQEGPLREMWHLLRETPDALWTYGLAIPDELYFECMLAGHDWESAARAFLTAETALMLTRGEGGHYLATVVLPEGEQAEIAADSPALALVGALATALAEGHALTSDEAALAELRKAA